MRKKRCIEQVQIGKWWAKEEDLSGYNDLHSKNKTTFLLISFLMRLLLSFRECISESLISNIAQIHLLHFPGCQHLEIAAKMFTIIMQLQRKQMKAV